MIAVLTCQQVIVLCSIQQEFLQPKINEPVQWMCFLQCYLREVLKQLWMGIPLGCKLKLTHSTHEYYYYKPIPACRTLPHQTATHPTCSPLYLLPSCRYYGLAPLEMCQNPPLTMPRLAQPSKFKPLKLHIFAYVDSVTQLRNDIVLKGICVEWAASLCGLVSIRILSLKLAKHCPQANPWCSNACTKDCGDLVCILYMLFVCRVRAFRIFKEAVKCSYDNRKIWENLLVVSLYICVLEWDDIMMMSHYRLVPILEHSMMHYVPTIVSLTFVTNSLTLKSWGCW